MTAAMKTKQMGHRKREVMPVKRRPLSVVAFEQMPLLNEEGKGGVKVWGIIQEVLMS